MRASFILALFFSLFSISAIANSISSTAANASGPVKLNWTVTSRSDVQGGRWYVRSTGASSKTVRSGTSTGSYSGTFYPNKNGTYKFELMMDKMWGGGADIILMTLATSQAVTVNVVKPGIPGNVGAGSDSNNGRVPVSWRAASGYAQRYEIVKRKNGGGWSSPIKTSSTSTTVSGLTTGAWDFMVRACNYTGCGSYSTAKRVNVAIPPNVPSSVTFSAVSSGSIDREGKFKVSWGASSSTPAVTGYQVYQCKGSCNTDSGWTRVYSAANTLARTISIPKSNALPNGSYRYRVRAYAKGGSYTTYSGWRTSGYVTVNRSPNEVTNFTQPQHGTQSADFTVAWSAVTGTFDPVTRYELQCSVDGGNFTYANCGSSNLGTTPSMKVSLPVGTEGEYKFQARACNGNGCGPWTAGSRQKVVPVNIPLPAPETPTFSAVPQKSEFGDYDIAWNKPSSGQWTHFELHRERSNDPDVACSDRPTCWKLVWSNTQETVYPARGDLEDRYRYRVRACNSYACSGWGYTDWFDVHNLEGIAPAVSLATADTPGTTPYSADVNYQGDAVISIPIDTAPGVNGLMPEIGIHYSGARFRERNNESLPEDILGYGWRISGLSQIRRCVKNRPNSDTIQLNDEDSLCLDGEPLVLVSGKYWQEGSLYRKLRDDLSLIELKKYVNNIWFEVSSPDGRVSQYGNTVDSTQRVHAKPVFGWSVNQVVDTFGNTMNFRYHRDIIEGINYPLEIIYGNGGDARIEFAYGTRSDAPPQPLDHDAIRQTQLVLLHHINVYLDNKLLREYRLITEPEPADGGVDHYRRLKQVQQCGYDVTGSISQCLNPMVFGWEEVDTSSLYDLDTGIAEVVDGLGKTTRFYHTTVREIAVRLASDDGIFFERPFGEGILPADAKKMEPEGGDYRTIVGEVRRSNGVANGWHTTKYYYQGVGLVSTKNWGFLGFYAQKVHDLESDIVTYRQFRQDFPHFGKIARQLQFQGSYGPAAQQLTEQQFRYGKQALSVGAGTTYRSVIEQRTDTIFEQNQRIGYRFESYQHNKSSYDTYGELPDGLVRTQKAASNVSIPAQQSFWGEVAAASVSGVERSEQRTTSYLNRTGSRWLVGFVNGEESRAFSGGVTGAPDRVQTTVSTPYGDTNKVGTLTRFPDHSELELTVEYTYGSQGNVTSETTRGADIESRSVSATGFLDGRYPGVFTNALGQTITVSYDPRFGFATRIVDANSRVNEVEYDPFGRETLRTNTDGVRFESEYSQCLAGSCPVYGDLLVAYKVSTHSAISPTVDRYYDLLGRLIQQDVAAFDGNRISRREFNYDLLGRLYLETAPFYPGPGESKPLTRYEYDIRNRVSKVIRPDGSETRTTYTPLAASQQVQVAITEDVLDSDGILAETQIRHELYGLSGDLVKTKDAVGTSEDVVTVYDYDGSGLLRSVMVNEDSSTQSSFVYDDAGNRTSLTGPNVGNVISSYNALGQLTGQIDNEGQAISYQYDKLGRLLEQADDDGIASWEYDPAGGIGSLARRTYSVGGVITFAEEYRYTDKGKLQQIDTTLSAGGETRSYSHSYGYDSQGRLEKVVYPAGNEAHYQYTAQGYLQQITDGSNPLKTFNKMNAFGQSVEEVYGNEIVTTRHYNSETGLLESIDTDSGQIQDNRYSWRSDGILESRLSNASGISREERFTYDSLNRLTAAETLIDGSSRQTLSTLYSKLGNILSKTASQPGATQVTGYRYGQSGNAGPNAVSQVAIDGIANTLHYDANGAVTRYDAVSGDDKWIRWNARQLPEEITLGDSQATATPTARDRFRYGPNGQRYYRESSWWDEEAQHLRTEKAFIIGDYEDLLPANDPDYQRIQKVRIEKNVLQVTVTDHLGVSVSTMEYLHRDHLGSIEKVTDESGGVILNAAYDPHGQRKKVDWSGELTKQELEVLLLEQGLTTRRGFTGHEHLDRTGIIHMNGRIYDPTLSRFLSPDPLVQAPTNSQSWNRYSYVFNNPLSYTDPSGYRSSLRLQNNGANGMEYIDTWGYGGGLGKVYSGFHDSVLSSGLSVGRMGGGAVTPPDQDVEDDDSTEGEDSDAEKAKEEANKTEAGIAYESEVVVTATKEIDHDLVLKVAVGNLRDTFAVFIIGSGTDKIYHGTFAKVTAGAAVGVLVSNVLAVDGEIERQLNEMFTPQERQEHRDEAMRLILEGGGGRE